MSKPMNFSNHILFLYSYIFVVFKYYNYGAFKPKQPMIINIYKK